MNSDYLVTEDRLGQQAFKDTELRFLRVTPDLGEVEPYFTHILRLFEFANQEAFFESARGTRS